jgi:hypothetical protein
MISVTTFLSCELLGAALLALWVVARFPASGPRTIRACAVAAAVALAGLRAVPFGVPAALALPHGGYAVLLGLVLPSFFAMFLAAAWLMRALAGAFGGSGGGGLPVSDS